jgi:sugar fermentation stimulation protein A
MTYDFIKKGTFISRPNRFLANVVVDGQHEVSHVKNTGRCKELLIEGATIYLQEHDNTNRKTKWSLITVKKEDRLVNIDSQAPNKVFHEWLKEGKLFNDIKFIKPEFTYKNSRIDFYLETETDKILIEVKGATLEENNIAKFPDAPTERGVKHILELCNSVEEGFKAYIVFVIQMNQIQYFTPNVKTHKAFADALKYADNKGVKILALDCEVTKDSLKIKDKVEVVL